MKFRTLSQELKFDESQSLDFRDIRRILDQRGGKSHGLRAGYVDLESVHGPLHLDRFLPQGHNACCILLTAHLGGRVQRHWTALVRNSSGLHFFDSLALGPILGKILDDGGKFLAFLNKHNVHRNTRKTQKSHRMVRTCGLHVAVRIFCWRMSNPQYEKWLFSATNCMNPDQLVALMTIVGHL